MSEATRIAALKAALEFRTGQSQPDDVLLLALQFDDYLADPTPNTDDGIAEHAPSVTKGNRAKR